MVNVQKSDFELYKEGHSKGSAYSRQILASRSRIDAYVRQLLTSGLRKNDIASSEEMALQQNIYAADRAMALIRSLAENNPELLESILKDTRDNLLRFEGLCRMDLPIFDPSVATAAQNSDHRSETMSY